MVYKLKFVKVRWFNTCGQMSQDSANSNNHYSCMEVNHGEIRSHLYMETTSIIYHIQQSGAKESLINKVKVYFEAVALEKHLNN